MDMREFLENRRRFPHAQLARYVGKYVAWSPDGTRIIAAHDDLDGLCRRVDASGYDAAEVVMEPIPGADELVLGGGLDE